MSEQNKIEQIKAYVELCEEEGYQFQHLDNLKFLLQEIERLQKEEEFWKQAAENQRENNYELLKKIAVKDEALKWYGDFGNWYVKDGSWPALEDKGERARLAYKGEGDAVG
ncbi:hypothetical protein ACI2LM_13310 [Paenibacillus lautus]|uniref:hypothetical protein n=1 Tax=Paenibacillus lautus TaxID=1401 RepID=UPI00384DB163